MSAVVDRKSGRFEAVSQPFGGRHRLAWQITCSGCGATLALFEQPGTGQRDEGLAKKFTQRGWEVGPRAARDLCPTCVANAGARPARPPAAEPPSKVLARIASVRARLATPSPEPAAMPEVPPASPPPSPNREARRAIHEAIDAVWDAARDVYDGSASDRSIGAALNVPWAWVAEVREAFFGPQDTNVATLDGLKTADDLVARAQAIEDRALALAADAEALKRDADAWRKRARG
jgi:hypothetical protein